MDLPVAFISERSFSFSDFLACFTDRSLGHDVGPCSLSQSGFVTLGLNKMVFFFASLRFWQLSRVVWLHDKTSWSLKLLRESTSRLSLRCTDKGTGIQWELIEIKSRATVSSHPEQH